MLLTRVGTRVFFKAFTPTSGGELWISDGTTAGTVLVKDITPGTDTSSFLENFVAVDDTLYFIVQDSSVGIQLWRSDGTAASTTLVGVSGLGATLDALGRVVKVQPTGLHPIRYSYDANGRLTTIKHGPDPDTSATRITSLTYKTASGIEKGYLDSMTDPESRVVQYSYDGAGRTVAHVFLAPDNRTIGFAYDGAGNLTGVTPPAPTPHPHTFGYSSVNLVESYTPPQVTPPLSPLATTHLNNLDRQLTRITQPDGKQVNFGFGSATGRLDTITLQPSGEIRSYSYNATTGQLDSLTAADVTLTFTYDGPLLKTETWAGNHTVTHTYDNNLFETGLQVDSQSGVSFGYDADGLLTTAGALTLTRRTDNGLLASTTLGNTTDTWTFSLFGELDRYTAQYNSGSLLDIQYLGRDKLGRITQKRESVEGGSPVDTFYRYDVAGRLYHACADANCTTILSEYTYDPNGNRLTAPNLVGSAVYDNQDRLVQYGNITYMYTANGDLATKSNASGATTYAYDALGNLRRVVLPNATQIDYLIDGRNRRVGKRVNGTLTQQWLYQDRLKPVAELNSNGTLVAQFVYGSKPNVPDFMIKSGTTYRLISDHLGSVRRVVNVSTGAIIQRMDYDEFGILILDDNPGFQPFGFAGGLYDRDTHLVRFGARDYDAESGRWTASDPIRFGGGDTNIHAYVANDPINYSDPSGLAGSGPEGGPPPVPVPGAPDAGWKWNPNAQNPRGGTWGPDSPLIGQSQPSGSWDPGGHWDIDDGVGNRRRYDPEGREISADEAHGGGEEESGSNGNSQCREVHNIPWWLPLLPFITPWPDPY